MWTKNRDVFKDASRSLFATKGNVQGTTAKEYWIDIETNPTYCNTTVSDVTV
jgi:hypothetical protein